MRKAIHRAMKVGKKEILRVIRVDKEKGNKSVIQDTLIYLRSKSTFKIKTKVKKSTPILPNSIQFSFT
jgi:hypothetical protein